jgi:hypothetical protein
MTKNTIFTKANLKKCGKHLHDRIIPLRREAWTRKTGLSAPLLNAYTNPET